MRVYLTRWVSLDVESNLRRIEVEAAAAAGAGASLCVFPESFLHGYTRVVDPLRVRGALRAVSSAHAEIAFCFGSFTEDRRNRATVWLGGEEVARYDKVHLFAPNDEARLWEPGERYAAVGIGGLTFGLMTCNDVRFPEQARALRLEARTDALIAIAWWPWRRDHVWSTLLRARAIENGVFALGCCVAASEVPEERFAGAGNHAFDPHGEPLRSQDDRTYDLEPSLIAPLIVDPLEGAVRVGRIEVFPGR